VRTGQNSILIFPKGKPGAHGQDVCRRAGLRAVVKADGAIQAEEIRIAGSGRVKALDAVCPASGNDLTMAVQNKINLLGRFMVVWGVRAPRCKIHQKQTGDHVSRGDFVSRALPITDQKFVEDGGRVSFDRLFLDLIHVCQQELGRRLEVITGGILNPITTNRQG